MAIYSGFSHWKWGFSMAMLVYQRVHWFSFSVSIFLGVPMESMESGWTIRSGFRHFFRHWRLGFHPELAQKSWFSVYFPFIFTLVFMMRKLGFLSKPRFRSSMGQTALLADGTPGDRAPGKSGPSDGKNARFATSKISWFRNTCKIL